MDDGAIADLGFSPFPGGSNRLIAPAVQQATTNTRAVVPLRRRKSERCRPSSKMSANRCQRAAPKTRSRGHSRSRSFANCFQARRTTSNWRSPGRTTQLGRGSGHHSAGERDESRNQRHPLAEPGRGMGGSAAVAQKEVEQVLRLRSQELGHGRHGVPASGEPKSDGLLLPLSRVLVSAPVRARQRAGRDALRGCTGGNRVGPHPQRATTLAAHSEEVRNWKIVDTSRQC